MVQFVEQGPGRCIVFQNQGIRGRSLAEIRGRSRGHKGLLYRVNGSRRETRPVVTTLGPDFPKTKSSSEKLLLLQQQHEAMCWMQRPTLPTSRPSCLPPGHDRRLRHRLDDVESYFRPKAVGSIRLDDQQQRRVQQAREIVRRRHHDDRSRADPSHPEVGVPNMRRSNPSSAVGRTKMDCFAGPGATSRK